MYTDDSDPGGVVRFMENGDIVEVCDTEADGWKAYASVTYTHNSKDTTYTIGAGGKGNCSVVDASDHNLLEDHWIYFKVWLAKDGHADEDTADYAVWYNDH